MSGVVAAATAVKVVRVLAPHEEAPAVVLVVRPARLPLDGGATIASHLYQLGWPDGTTAWHLRHTFEPLPNGDQL